MKHLNRLAVILFAASLVLTGCNKDEENADDTVVMVDPSNPNAIAGVLVIGGSKNNGNPPPQSNSSTAPNVFNSVNSASVVRNNTVYLPFNFETSPGATQGYGGCYVQVLGANTYWNIPGSSNTYLDGQIILPVGIPANVLEGEFTLVYCIYDNTGQVSNILSTLVRVGEPEDCPGYAYGNDGLTILTYNLGNSAGTVEVDWDTYSVPDRIDVFLGNQWVDGTGNALAPGEFPPMLSCGDAEPSDGYVGDYGTFSIPYTPASKTITIYVSGCLGGGTAWDVSVSCPN